MVAILSKTGGLSRRDLLRMAGAGAVSAGATYWLSRPGRFSSYCYVQMGTSITAGAGTKLGGAGPAMVGSKLNMRAVNAGMPGASAGVHKFPDVNVVSLCALVDAIVSGDWSQQVVSHEPIRAAAVSRLMAVPFSSVTHLGLEYGTNDFQYDRPMGNDGACSKETFKGALNYSLQKLLSAYPKLRVFLITPSWMLTPAGLDSDDNPNGIGIYLGEYVDAMRRIGELNHVPCLDLWRTLGANKYNQKTYLADGVHPSDFGVIRRAEAIAGFIDSAF
jgi:lysophospholipase L1-like esterase